MRRIKMYSLDFLMYAHEVRLEEDELMDEGYMEHSTEGTGDRLVSESFK
jgi:hypothetical protein